MKKILQDPGYAAEKLVGSWVRYKGAFYAVSHVSGSGRTVLEDVFGNVEEVMLKDVDLSSPQFGNVNYRGDCFYWFRIPSRTFKQGFRSGNTAWRSSAGQINKRPVINSKTLSCLTGNYPSFDSCCELIYNKENRGVAFNRFFSIENVAYKKDVDNGEVVPKLLYKTRVVGDVDLRKQKATLEPKFFMLKECLNENL